MLCLFVRPQRRSRWTMDKLIYIYTLFFFSFVHLFFLCSINWSVYDDHCVQQCHHHQFNLWSFQCCGFGVERSHSHYIEWSWQMFVDILLVYFSLWSINELRYPLGYVDSTRIYLFIITLIMIMMMTKAKTKKRRKTPIQ